jgi:hypothetical protein
MAVRILDLLLAEDLLANACAFSSAPALRLFFTQRPEVAQVAEAVRNGMVAEEEIRDFVTQLLGDLATGVHFRHDLTLAALAVALEECQTPFVEELLRELADLRLSEMPLSPRVAQEVLEQRATRTPSAAQPVAP